VNSIRPDGGTSLLGLCEVRPEAHASRKGKSRAVAGGAGQRDNERVLKETVSERKAATSPEGGWRQNGRKCKRGKQGDLSGATRRSWPQGPKNCPAGVRASVVARKRVTSAEPRDVGRWKEEEQNNGSQTDASARKGYATDGAPPSANDLAGTACLAGILVRTNRGTHLTETPLTGKLDALCGQLGYVVLRFENPAFTGVFEVSTAHNILHLGRVTNLSLRRRCRHVQGPRPLFSGDFASNHATSEPQRSNGRSL
jgi:hypothetical protein